MKKADESARDVADAIARGAAFLEQGNAVAARTAFEGALRRDAESFDAQLGLARALFAMQHADADAAIERAGALQPDRPEPLIWQARIARAKVEAASDTVILDGALIRADHDGWDNIWLVDELLEAALMRAPDDPALLQERTQWLRFVGPGFDAEQGIAHLRATYSTRGNDPSLAHLVAMELIELGDMERAVEILDHLEAQHGPLDAVALRARAEAMIWLKDDDRREADLRALVRLDPDHAGDHRTLAGFLARKKRLTEAVPLWRHVLRLPGHGRLDYRTLGRLLARLDRYDEAEAVYTQGIAMAPDYNCLYMLRGVARRKLGRPDAARADFDRAIDLNPKCSAAFFNRGRVAESHGDTGGMLQDWFAVLEFAPKNVAANLALADHYLGEKRWRHCFSHADAALEMQPQSAGGLAMRGRALFELGQTESGLKDLDLAVAHAPNRAAVRNQRAIVLGKTGRIDLQIEELRLALQSAPRDTGVLHNLAVCLAKTDAPAEAFGIFDDLVRRRDNANDLAWRGECHRLLGRPKEALADLEHALKLGGDAGWIADKLELARADMGR